MKPMYIALQEDEAIGRADCGCELTYVSGTNNAAYFQCTLHASAPELLEALKMLCNIVTHPHATKAEMGNIAKETQAILAQAEGRG